MECAICYDTFENINVCVTPCGHSFCFKCMMKSLNMNDSCPCCRAPLRENMIEDSDDESDVDEIESITDDGSFRDVLDISSIISISNNTNNDMARPNEIAEEFKKHGYTMEDIIVLWTWRVDRQNSKYSQRYLEKMHDDINSIIRRIDSEKLSEQISRVEMEEEDKEINEEINICEGLELLFGVN